MDHGPLEKTPAPAGWIQSKLAVLQSTDAELFVWLFRQYFKRFRVRIGLILVMIAIVSATTAAIALLVKDVVNEIFVAQNENLFLALFATVLLIFVSKGAASYYQAVLSARISNEIVADVQKRLFAHVLRQSMNFFGRYSTDALLMRFNEGAEGFKAILTSVLINGVRDAATVAALVAVMITQDPVMTIGSLIVTPVILIGIAALLKRIKRAAEQELARYTDLYKRVRENVQGITVIKSFNLESAANDSAGEVVDELRSRADRIAMLQAAPLPLLEAAGGLAVGIAILYAGGRVVSGNYDAGTFVSFITALLLAADPARRLSQMRVTLRASFVRVNMVFDLLKDDEPEAGGVETLSRFRGATGHGVPPAPPSIVFDKVGFGYAQESPVLDDFSLTVAPGEMVALVGPSGAGKSTVFKLLLKFYQPTSGTIRIDGIDLAGIETHAVRDVISYVGQSNFIFHGSIRDNLTLMNPSVTQPAIEQACARVGLDDYIAALPQGYDTNVGELGTMISGGQAQRLNLARALIKNSPVLLLDEVTSALDAENENRVRSMIRDLVRDKTIFVIAHRLSTVKEADRIAVLSEGRIVDVGRHDELIARNEYYEKIVALQFA